MRAEGKTDGEAVCAGSVGLPELQNGMMQKWSPRNTQNTRKSDVTAYAWGRKRYSFLVIRALADVVSLGQVVKSD